MENKSKEEILKELLEGRKVSDRRRELLGMAIDLGADLKTLEYLRDSRIISPHEYVTLPPGRLEACSRGRGWAGWRARGRVRGKIDVWADRVKTGYRADKEGRWWVGHTDGFTRKRVDEWDVERIKVGSETWTIAD